MTYLQKQLTETYENLGYSAALDFWKENSNIIGNLSPNEISILNNIMNRYCLINNDSKTAEIILSDKKEKNTENQKITESLFELGELYYNNVAPERNPMKAEELYTLAAEQGSVDDMYKLANMYKTGDCIQRNYEKAFFWLEKVALSGNKIAQFELAEMYMQGKGVTKNKEEAIKWYKISNETSNSYDLSTMIIPNGITCIEESAFEGFENLVKIVIPDTVTRIEKFAFKECLNLKDIIYNNEKIFVKDGAFENCNNLAEESVEFLKKNCINIIFIKGNGEINDFCISKDVVTQELYQKIMKKNPSEHKGKMKPVETISWFDAIYFCNKLSEVVGVNPVYSVNGNVSVKEWNYVPHQDQWLKGNITQDLSSNGFRLLSKEEWNYAQKCKDKIENLNCHENVWEWLSDDYRPVKGYRYCCIIDSYNEIFFDQHYGDFRNHKIGFRIARSVF